MSELQKLDRKNCWKIGGVVTNFGNQTSDNLMLGVKMKKTKNGFEVVNYGMQISPEDSQQLNRNLFSSGDGEASLTFAQGRRSWSSSTNGKQLCQRVLDYKCLEDITINNIASLQAFTDMKCTELKKDLFINGLDLEEPQNSFDVFQKIQKIHGRLVIEDVHSEVPLVFKNLTEVGGYEENRNLPNIQIHSNVMHYIHFPKLVMNKCTPKSKRNCVSVEDSWSITNIEEPLKIEFGSRKAYQQIKEVDLINPEPGSKKHFQQLKKIEKDPSVINEEYDSVIVDWQGQGYGEDASIYHGVPSLLILCGLIGYVVWFFCFHWKNYETYDYDTIEKEDDKEGTNDDDDYFKLDGNKEKDRDSGMDDLGSN